MGVDFRCLQRNDNKPRQLLRHQWALLNILVEFTNNIINYLTVI